MPAALGILILLVAVAWLIYALRACRVSLEQQTAVLPAPVPTTPAPSEAPVSPPPSDTRLIGFDDETFLPNRRYFDHQVKAEWSRCVRNERPIALLLGRFDRHDGDSEDTSDQAKTIAYALDTEARRGADLVFRYDRETFAIILVETEHNDAVNVARRMQSHVRSLGLPVPEGADRESRTLSFAVISAKNEDRSLNMQVWLKEAEDAHDVISKGARERLISRSL